MTHPDLEVIAAAPDQAPILANLLELYAHDFSEFHDVQIGRRQVRLFVPAAFIGPIRTRHPFLVKIDGKVGGLVLVRKGRGC